MIGADIDGVFRSFKVVMPVFHAFNNGKHFTVMDIVVTFYRCALARPIHDRVEKRMTIVIKMRLRDDSERAKPEELEWSVICRSGSK